MTDLEKVSVQTFGRSLAHELGHTLGLNHPFDEDKDRDENDIRNEQGLGPLFKPDVVLDNLMNSEGNKAPLSSNRGTQLTPNQRKKIDKKLDEVKTIPKE